ncbi:hypothetical protein EMCRGX_G004282 [Ephydatia muelleri]
MDVYCWHKLMRISHFSLISLGRTLGSSWNNVEDSDSLTALQGVEGLVMVLSESPVGYPEVHLAVVVFFSHCSPSLWHQVLCGCLLQTAGWSPVKKRSTSWTGIPAVDKMGSFRSCRSATLSGMIDAWSSMVEGLIAMRYSRRCLRLHKFLKSRSWLYSRSRIRCLRQVPQIKILVVS